MNVTESVKFANIAATTAAFTLKGGRYGLAAIATWGGGSVILETLGPDGSTYLSTGTTFSANGYATVDLPPGTYQVVIATATAVYFSASSVPI